MFDFLDVFIVGAILYYIVQAVRRAASAQADRRPPDSIAREGGESLSWAERTQRALEGAAEWEAEQERKRGEAALRAEIAALRAGERDADALPPGGAAPSLSDALAGVAALLEQQAASRRGPRESEPFRFRSRSGEREPFARERPGRGRGDLIRRSRDEPTRHSAEVTLRRPGDVTRRPRETLVSRPRTELIRRQSEMDDAVVEVEAREIRAAEPDARGPDTGPAVERRTAPAGLTNLPGLGRLTPLQRAIVYGEIFGRPVALGGGVDDSPQFP